MPYKTRKVRGKNCYKVYKPKDKKVFSKCTTKENAMKQIRLLRALQFNKSFKTESQKKGGSKRKTMKKRITKK
tara:strand:+ start:463 stop:681 length:219 start_codon:yes stop_codon:yes gene_type:complete